MHYFLNLYLDSLLKISDKKDNSNSLVLFLKILYRIFEFMAIHPQHK